MADRFSQIRTVLIEIAMRRKRFRHVSSGYINESELASALGVASQTVHRILHQKRVQAEADYEPSARMLDGIAHVLNLGSRGEASDYIDNATPLPAHIIEKLVRPS